MKRQSRRNMLRLGGLTALGALAGCSAGTATEGDIERTDRSTTSVKTTTPDATTSDRPQYRVDQRGGPENLLVDPTIRAISIAGYDGPAPYVFTPAILWVETDATVTWAVEGGTHAIAAYHPDSDHALRIPEAADPFDSGVLEIGDTFQYTFETPGVYNYYCRPHEPYGMVGIVVAGEARSGPGTVDGANVDVDVAGEHLTRLLGLADIDVTRPSA